MFTATLLICTAVSFGVEVNHEYPCSIGGSGVVETRAIAGTFDDAGRCADAGYTAAKAAWPGLAAKGQIATWQCVSK